MQKFILRALIFSVLVGTTWVLVLRRTTVGFEDRFYHKFRYECGSIVTGSSRALLGINPDIVDPHGTFAKPFLNFAFTQKTSPYGEVYYDAIRKKIDRSVTNGLFILEVNPLAIYSYTEDQAEEELILGRMHFFSLDPNLEYPLINGEKPAYMFYFVRPKVFDGVTMHTNGWNESNAPIDSVYKIGKIKEQYDAHADLFSRARDSSYRLEWLRKTITALDAYGTVVLVRVPVSPQMASLENQYYPAFDVLMKRTADQTHAAYISYIADTTYEFYDIHHMTAPAALRFSEVLRSDIVTLSTTAE
jgi:hypothetical protein